MLNLGLRWEFDPFFRGVDSQTSAFEASTRNGFNVAANGDVIIQGTGPLHLPQSIRKSGPGLYVPRVGFAFRPTSNDRTVIRGAFGLFAIFLDTNMALQWAHVPPIMIRQSINNPVASPVFANSAATGEFY
jgi:hypothetical protein